jgi:hypothetical protein
MSHTHANLEVSAATYTEVEQLLKAAGYDHAFGPDGMTIDMHGIALVLSRGSRTSPLELAMKFHEVYERLAPSFGYETRTETQVFNPKSTNGRLMVAVCAELLEGK